MSVRYTSGIMKGLREMLYSFFSTLNELVEQEELQLDSVSREIEKEQSIAEQLEKEITVCFVL